MSDASRPRTAFLRGREHQRLGGLELLGEGPAAIALSRGGARKTYAHTDPNEDCAAFALGEAGWLAVIADGHHGEHGSEAALEAILTEFAGPWTASRAPAHSEPEWREQGYRALLRVNAAILERAGQHEAPPAPTTFTLVLVRPAEDLLLSLSVGDSHLFTVGAEHVAEVGQPDPDWAFTPFLGYEQANREGLERFALVDQRPLSTIRAVVLATDGLSERGIGVPDPTEVVRRIVARATQESPADRRAVDICRAVTETALHSHRRNRAGDNVACSVLWIAGAGDEAPDESPAD